MGTYILSTEFLLYIHIFLNNFVVERNIKDPISLTLVLKKIFKDLLQD